jgi:hypothetical protein
MFETQRHREEEYIEMEAETRVTHLLAKGAKDYCQPPKA